MLGVVPTKRDSNIRGPIRASFSSQRRKMTLDKATVARLRSAHEQYHAAAARAVATPLELEVMKTRLGALWIANGYPILQVLEANV
jgi:hypothetical protein